MITRRGAFREVRSGESAPERRLEISGLPADGSAPVDRVSTAYRESPNLRRPDDLPLMKHPGHNDPLYVGRVLSQVCQSRRARSEAPQRGTFGESGAPRRPSDRFVQEGVSQGAPSGPS